METGSIGKQESAGNSKQGIGKREVPENKKVPERGQYRKLKVRELERGKCRKRESAESSKMPETESF